MVEPCSEGAERRRLAPPTADRQRILSLVVQGSIPSTLVVVKMRSAPGRCHRLLQPGDFGDLRAHTDDSVYQLELQRDADYPKAQ